jgi:hypothetical protein
MMGRASRIHVTIGNCMKTVVGVVKRRRPRGGDLGVWECDIKGGKCDTLVWMGFD